MKKKKSKKVRKSNKFAIIVVVVVSLVVVFNALFIVVHHFHWNRGCNIIVGRITHNYAGRVYTSCSAVDCEGTEKYVFGRLSKNKYRELKNEIKAARAGEWYTVCYLFD